MRKILDTPELLALGAADKPGGKVDVSSPKSASKASACAC